MKNAFLPCLLLFLPLCLSAQITFEHEYPVYGAERVKLEISGIKYYHADVADRKLLLFNEDHTPWKTIDLNISIDSVVQIFVWDVSETRIVSDPLLEFSISYYGFDNGFFASGQQTRNEDGAVLLNEQAFIRSINGTDKMVSAQRVYSLPGLALEHDYGGLFEVQRMDAAVDIYSRKTGNYILLYNDEHALLDSFFVGQACTNCSVTLQGVSQTSIDPDPAFELLFSVNDFNLNIVSLFVQKDGGPLLFEVSGAPGESLYMGLVGPDDGFPETRLMLTLQTQNAVKLYNLPGFSSWSIIDFVFSTYPVDQAGLKAYPFETPPGASTLQLKNLPNFGLWKALAKPPAETWYPTFFTRHLIDNDDDVEFGYFIESASPGYYGLRIRDETGGAVILEEPYVQYARIHEIPGAPVKLIYAMSNNGPQDPVPAYTKVYGLGGVSGLPVVSPAPALPVIASPNPGAGDLWLDFKRVPEQEIGIAIFDLTGKLVFTRTFGPAESLLLPASAFGASGLYLLDIRSGQARTMAKVIRG